MKNYAVLPLLMFAFCAFATDVDVQIVKVEATPSGDNASITLVFPENGAILENRVEVQTRVMNFPIGVIMEFDRADEIGNYYDGQSIRAVVDNYPCVINTGPSLSPFDMEGQPFEDVFRFALPYDLKDGFHFVRVFLCRSYGESLKKPGCFDLHYFYVKNKKLKKTLNMKAPFLTYNEPSGQIELKSKDPILLDFYLSNCVLSEDGYRVRVTVDGKISKILLEWAPYYIYGLDSGKHKLKLELLNKNNKLVKGPCSLFEQTFLVE